MTAPSRPFSRVGARKKLSCFVFKRDLFGFRELWHPVAGKDAGGRDRAGFLQSEPFPICSTGLAGGQGRGSSPASLVLNSVGGGVQIGIILRLQ